MTRIESGGDREAVKAALERLWGRSIGRVGMSGSANGADVRVNQKRRTRVLLWLNTNRIILAFDRYLPLAEIIGSDPTRLGFERVPVLGAGRESLARGFGDSYHHIEYGKDRSLDFISLPPTENDKMFGDTKIKLVFDRAGKVQAYTLCREELAPYARGAKSLVSTHRSRHPGKARQQDASIPGATSARHGSPTGPLELLAPRSLPIARRCSVQ